MGPDIQVDVELTSIEKHFSKLCRGRGREGKLFVGTYVKYFRNVKQLYKSWR